MGQGGKTDQNTFIGMDKIPQELLNYHIVEKRKKENQKEQSLCIQSGLVRLRKSHTIQLSHEIACCTACSLRNISQ